MLGERSGSEDFGSGAVDGAALGPITHPHMDKDFARQNFPCCLQGQQWHRVVCARCEEVCSSHHVGSGNDKYLSDTQNNLEGSG